MFNGHEVTKEFERALCEYTGAKYAVTTNSCTMAITLALAFHKEWAYVQGERGWQVRMPKLSYVGVPAAIRNAELYWGFRDDDWQGEYEFEWRGTICDPFVPMGVWDSARRFTSGMFRPGSMQCVSFHATKILADTQGGAILHDDDEADAWLRRARFDGRTEGVNPKDDQVQSPSWHCYLSVDVSARLLLKLSTLPRHNADLPRSDYPDLSKLRAFQ